MHFSTKIVRTQYLIRMCSKLNKLTVATFLGAATGRGLGNDTGGIRVAVTASSVFMVVFMVVVTASRYMFVVTVSMLMTFRRRC